MVSSQTDLNYCWNSWENGVPWLVKCKTEATSGGRLEEVCMRETKTTGRKAGLADEEKEMSSVSGDII